MRSSETMGYSIKQESTNYTSVKVLELNEHAGENLDIYKLLPLKFGCLEGNFGLSHDKEMALY